MDTATTGGFDVLKRQSRVSGVPTTDPTIDTITDQDAAHCGEYRSASAVAERKHSAAEEREVWAKLRYFELLLRLHRRNPA